MNFIYGMFIPIFLFIVKEIILNNNIKTNNELRITELNNNQNITISNKHSNFKLYLVIITLLVISFICLIYGIKSGEVKYPFINKNPNKNIINVIKLNLSESIAFDLDKTTYSNYFLDINSTEYNCYDSLNTPLYFGDNNQYEVILESKKYSNNYKATIINNQFVFYDIPLDEYNLKIVNIEKDDMTPTQISIDTLEPYINGTLELNFSYLDEMKSYQASAFRLVDANNKPIEHKDFYITYESTSKYISGSTNENGVSYSPYMCTMDEFQICISDSSTEEFYYEVVQIKPYKYVYTIKFDDY